jgi:NAD(P)H-dependent FMN reductase
MMSFIGSATGDSSTMHKVAQSSTPSKSLVVNLQRQLRQVMPFAEMDPAHRALSLGDVESQTSLLRPDESTQESFFP